jgi:hypothetical protein
VIISEVKARAKGVVSEVAAKTLTVFLIIRIAQW